MRGDTSRCKEALWTPGPEDHTSREVPNLDKDEGDLEAVARSCREEPLRVRAGREDPDLNEDGDKLEADARRRRKEPLEVQTSRGDPNLD